MNVATERERPARVLLIAPSASYRISAYVEAAKRLAIDLVVGSSGDHSLVEAVADGLRLDLQDSDNALATILAANRISPFGAVIASEDATVELACLAAQSLGLAHNPPQAAVTATRKDLARQAQSDAGLRVPRFRVLSLLEPIPVDLDVGYPCVLKPLSLSGSRGVMRADDLLELEGRRAQLMQLFENNSGLPFPHLALVEAFIPGQELALEGMLVDGALEVLAIFDKPEPLDGPYFEESYYITPSRLDSPTQQRVAACAEDVCRAYGLQTGPIHAEFRVNEEGVWPLELAARTIGGDCARLLQFGAGHGLEELVLARALSLSIDMSRSSGAGGVLMIPIETSGVLRRVEGVTKAEKVPYIEDVFIAAREGHELSALPEGASYLGFIFARAPDAESAEVALRAAYACLKVVVAPMWRIQVA